MEISFNLNAKIWKPVPLISTARIPKKNLKINIISCGIQELSMQREKNTNLYQVLSLESPTVGFDEIKKAYRSLALQYHPDLSPSSKKEESTTKFVELQKAYETLSDPISRNRYDRQLSLGPSSIDFGIGNAHRKEARSDISKEVWENQLNGLQRRSADRMMMKKKRYM